MLYNKGTAIPTYIYGIICELATMGYIDENQTLNADFLNKVHIEELIDLNEIGKEVKRRLGGLKMDCETDDCGKEKLTCKGCFYSKEIWKDIKNYEGLYQVSNYGRIKSLGRYMKNHSKKQWLEEKILIPQLNDKRIYGYWFM